MKVLVCGLLLLIGVGTPHTVHAHAMILQPIEGGFGVAVVYDDGTPAAFIDVQVFAPDTPQAPVLAGTTDRNGWFMFRPDMPGEWRVTVDDGMGHARTLTMQADAAGLQPAITPLRLPKLHGAVMGIALIFAVFGWTAFFRLTVKGKKSCTFPKE